MNKKITFKSLFAFVICCFALNSLNAQVLIYEDFESGDESTSVGTLNDWTTSIPEFTFTQTDACVGSQSISAPLNGGNNTFVTSPTQNVQGGNDLDISFQYKVVDASNGNLISGNVVNIELEYSLDGGTTWVNYDTIDQNDLPTSDCSTNSFTIPSSNLTSTDTFTWRFTATNLSGDLLVFVDNFAAIEQVGCIQPVKITVDESSISLTKQILLG
ncbi:hypothetical protein ACFSO9_15175 [Mesonia maritima]|uniref:hypothetical protein n=1 Tax=Mesonia maritima TaxID=1793873 RepID=UPI0036309293